MSRFTFICARTTADFVVPLVAPNQAEFNRKVSLAFRGMVGGMLRVGDLLDRPVQDAVPYHLLCDGSEISRSQFPDLVDLLNPGAETANLPDYTGAVTITAPTVTQEVDDGGTVSTGGTVTDAGDVGGSTGGNVPSGGRVRQFLTDETADLP
ncbi:MAG: hypothetical protein V4696_13415 [Pseudomonadota bacterium]